MAAQQESKFPPCLYAGIGVPILIGNFRRMFGKKKVVRELDLLIIDEVQLSLPGDPAHNKQQEV